VLLIGTGFSNELFLAINLYIFRPQELDSAARRRFVKRIYIPLPDLSARQAIISNLLKDQKHTLIDKDIEHICTLTEGFSGADMHSLCHDAALGPIRDIHDIELLSSDQVENIFLKLFKLVCELGSWYFS
jgi:SpoVK/Ycf46/Vps4 family AAA+-type ATPase